MFQGTGSDVGKSFLVAGLARAYTRRGLGVRPFKPQNMSNNAAVAADGGEIGRAQALQARACGVAPSIHMNPVLLKPESDRGAQVVVQGRVLGSARARGYVALKPALMPKVLESFARLGREADLVLVEGAGSAAEVNLRAADIANMGFALAADVPVVLIGDIDRGGVIASLVGTCALLTDGERALLAGHIVNRFRGDPALFDAGLAVIAERTGIDCFGVVPYFAEAHRLPAEDAVALERPAPAPDDAGSESPRPIRISVLRLSRISNFDDFDPLAAEADVELRILRPGEALPGDCDLVILPGSKAALADLAMLRAEGWDIDILAHRRRGGMVLGICGGLQLLHVALGGTLIQHIPDAVPDALAHEQPNPRHEPGHSVTVTPGTLLHKIVGSGEMNVNSAHHQAAADAPGDAIINARATDGVIEGIEGRGPGFCLGVQWHPEYEVDPGDVRIFAAFVNAARNYRA